MLENDDENDRVRIHAAAIAIAETGNNEKAYSLLNNLLGKKSYKNTVARGAIEGFKVIAIESKDKQIIDDIESILIEKSKIGNESRLRQTATSALGYVTKYHKDRTNAIEHLKTLLEDQSIHVRNTSYSSLGNTFAYSQDQNMNRELKQKLEKEDNDFVKQTGLSSINLINESISSRMPLVAEKSLLKDNSYKLNDIEEMERTICLY